MHDALIAYMNALLSEKLSDSEKDIIKQAFVPKKLRKHQYLLQEGEVCKLAGFVVKGALKQYTVDEAGKENILQLFIENWWAGDRESFVNRTPSIYCIDAFEDTEMLVLTRERAENYIYGQRFMTDLMTILSQKQSLQLLKRVHATKTLTAEQRLTDLENTYPEFLKRFPQHIIASYLGMTKETLSRIRASALKK